MKRVKKPVFFIVAILTLLIAVTAIFGVKVQGDGETMTYIKGASDIRWGIDIQGGVEVTFTPEEGVEATEDELDAAKSIIELRMVSSNITDYEIYTDVSNNRIIVRFPWSSDEEDFDAEAAVEELSATALLTFRQGDSYMYEYYDDEGNIIYSTPDEETAETIYIDGSHVVSATAGTIQDSDTGSFTYGVSIQLSDEGTELFAAATEENLDSTISIWMDDILISAPTVEAVISDGECWISGSFTAAEATALAAKIQGGALPFQLETTNLKVINPTLGLQSLDAMTLAGIIAFILVAILMILIFRLPGVVAVITLLGQIGITFAAISGYFPAFDSFTMTLPGIAGIILSIGMGVDANIITASRIKEELANGKTLDGAIQKGCQNSISAIIDGNMTIIIVSIMLIGVFGPSNILSRIFGESTTGSIYAFGFTLLVGVIANFIMAVFASRLMIKSLSGFKTFRNKWFFGGEKAKKVFNVDFYKNRKKFFAGSLAIIAIGLVFNVAFGAKLDVQFAGGALIVYSVDGEVDQDEVKDVVIEATGRDADVVSSTLIATGENQVTVTFSGTETFSIDEQKVLEEALTESFSDRTFTVADSSSVEASTGLKFFQKTLVCLAITVALLLAYIAIRFKKIGGSSAGLTAVLALVHDVAIIYFVFIIFGMSISEIFIAVILTILGYSLNDTIVIYDRIRENRKRLGAKADVEEVMNLSLNQTLMRSILTSVTTFTVLLVVFIVASLYGLTTVSTFALPMMVGVVCGCYSSLFIAAPTYTMWVKRKLAKAKK